MSPKGYHSPATAGSPPPPVHSDVPFEILSRKRASIVSSIGDESVGNATIHPDHFDNNNNKNQRNGGNGANHLDRPQAPSPPQGSTTNEDNQHYNDTIFGDEQPRTYSPNELDSLRNVYQRNVVDTPNEDKVRIFDTTQQHIGIKYLNFFFSRLDSHRRRCRKRRYRRRNRQI